MAAGSLTRSVKSYARRGVIAVGKRVPWILTWSRKSVAAIRGVTYRRVCARNPVDPKVVIFEAYSGRGYSCSPRALYEAMLADERFADYELIWAFRNPHAAALAEHGLAVAEVAEVHGQKRLAQDLDTVFGAEALERLGHAKLVMWGSREYMRSFARAGTWISNFILPTYLLPREGQRYVQTWHGTPLKRLGCDISARGNVMYQVRDIHERYHFEGARLTYLLAPSRFTTDKLATAFDLDRTGRRDAIIEEGYPRNDFPLTATAEQINAIKERLDIPAGKRVILYAPTWRDDQHTTGVGFTFESGIDFDRLQRELGEDTVVLFRAHYLISSQFDFARYNGFVRNVSAVSDVNDLYVISDILVTDYSSVFFDFANLERPIIFFMYDLESYAENLRGFYLGLDELPGPVVKTQDELVAALRSAGHPDSQIAERYAAFNERFTYLDDGHASERVLARIFPDGSAHLPGASR